MLLFDKTNFKVFFYGNGKYNIYEIWLFKIPYRFSDTKVTIL